MIPSSSLESRVLKRQEHRRWGATLRAMFHGLMGLSLVFLTSVGVRPAQASPGGGTLQQQIQSLFSSNLVPILPRGASVTVLQGFPYQNPSEPDRTGLPSQLSAILLAETKAALTKLSVDLDSGSRPLDVAQQQGLDPCIQPDAARFVIAGEYLVTGNELRIQYRICNRESATDKWPMITTSLEPFRGVTLKPEPRQNLELWVAGVGRHAPAQSMAPAHIPSAAAGSPQPSALTSTAARRGTPLVVEAQPDRGLNSVYHLDETVQYQIRANQDCYVYVWNLTENGTEMTLVYPNTFQRDNKLFANQVEQIGAERNRPGSFRVKAPTGRETLLVWASTMQFTDYSALMNLFERGALSYSVPVASRGSYQAARNKAVGVWMGPTETPESLTVTAPRPPRDHDAAAERIALTPAMPPPVVPGPGETYLEFAFSYLTLQPLGYR